MASRLIDFTDNQGFSVICYYNGKYIINQEQDSEFRTLIEFDFSRFILTFSVKHPIFQVP
jgi:hypothetical protein